MLISEIFKPSWRKIVTTFVLIILSVVTIFLLLRVVVGCMFDWGCDTLPPGAGLVYLFAIVLVAPAYYSLGLFEIIFRPQYNQDFLLLMFALFEIIYLYFLGCSISVFWTRHKEDKKQQKIIDDNLTSEISNILNKQN